jgi:hypothetical protein
MEATIATAATATTDSNIIEGSKGDNRFAVLSPCKRLKTCDSASCIPTKDNDAMTLSIIHIPQLPSTDASSSDILLSTVAKETTPTLEDIPSELFIQHILPYVGDHQYCFVAAVNHNFHTAYVTAFPKKVTRFNVSTIEHAKIGYDEIMDSFYCITLSQHILCKVAAREGNLTVLKYLHSLGCLWDSDTCANAAKNGHLDIVKWCRQNGCRWNIWICCYAAENGHLDVIKWCRQNGCPWDSFTCSNAAKNGHLDVVKWCHENGCRWYSNTCSEAAENGHLDVIKWCHENGCPWDAKTCHNAAGNGRIDILKWCRQNGCEWRQSTCEALESKGFFDVLQWSFENGCKCIVCSKYGNLD